MLVGHNAWASPGRVFTKKVQSLNGYFTRLVNEAVHELYVKGSKQANETCLLTVVNS